MRYPLFDVIIDPNLELFLLRNYMRDKFTLYMTSTNQHYIKYRGQQFLFTQLHGDAH